MAILPRMKILDLGIEVVHLGLKAADALVEVVIFPGAGSVISGIGIVGKGTYSESLNPLEQQLGT